MNKYLILSFALLGSLSFGASSFNVSVTGTRDLVTVNFSTVKKQSSQCFFTNHELLLKYGNWEVAEEDGKIELTARVNPSEPCLTVFGMPHKGVLQLQRGASLPKLVDGNYHLTINGESYGELVVSKTGVSLKP